MKTYIVRVFGCDGSDADFEVKAKSEQEAKKKAAALWYREKSEPIIAFEV